MALCLRWIEEGVSEERGGFHSFSLGSHVQDGLELVVAFNGGDGFLQQRLQVFLKGRDGALLGEAVDEMEEGVE